MNKPLAEVKKALRDRADKTRAEFFPRFFKAGPGDYAEGDKFLGTTVPNQRTIARQFYKRLSLTETVELLYSPWHEDRLTALFILVLKFEKGDSSAKQQIVDSYLKNSKFVNNWDLVDSSAHQILGEAYSTNLDGRRILYHLARSDLIWERRIAIIATYAFIKKGDLTDTLALAEKLLNDKHDLIHKAVGWMLREAGKQDQPSLLKFLDKHAKTMPRTALRYTIERLAPAQKKHYLNRPKTQ